MAIKKAPLPPPEDLIKEEPRRASDSNLSRYVAHGLRRQVRADHRGHYLVALDTDFGPLTEEEREEGRRIWSGEA